MSTTDFYQYLNVSRTATKEEIKKGFKRQALLYHPDKSPSPEAALHYEHVQRAYHVLSDDRLRPVYDKYGENGLAAVEKMGGFAPFLDPTAMPAIQWLITLLTFIVALLILFPTLLSLKIDFSVFTYVLAFIPLYIIEIGVVVFIVMSVENTEERETGWGGMVMKMAALSYVFTFDVFTVLLSLYLDGTTSMSLWKTFVPYFVWEFFNFLLILIPTITQSREPIYDGLEIDGASSSRKLNAREIVGLFIANFHFYLIRVIQVVLIVHRIASSSGLDWALVFLPIWMLGFFEVCRIISTFIRPSPNSTPPMFQVCIFVVWGTLFFTFFGLLVKRLDSLDNLPMVAMILVPLFMVLSLLFCCVACVLPVAVSGQKRSFDEEMATGVAQPFIIRVDRRIAPIVDGGDGTRTACSMQ